VRIAPTYILWISFSWYETSNTPISSPIWDET